MLNLVMMHLFAALGSYVNTVFGNWLKYYHYYHFHSLKIESVGPADYYINLVSLNDKKILKIDFSVTILQNKIKNREKFMHGREKLQNLIKG